MLYNCSHRPIHEDQSTAAIVWEALAAKEKTQKLKIIV